MRRLTSWAICWFVVALILLIPMFMLSLLGMAVAVKIVGVLAMASFMASLTYCFTIFVKCFLKD